MSRAREAEDRAAQWILAQEDEGWTESDQAGLDSWLAQSDGHKAAYWRLKHSWREADRIAALGGGRSEPAPRIARLRRWFPASIAAAILAVVSVGYMLSAPPRHPATAMATKRIATAVGDRKVVALADGSKVELNTASRARVALTGRSREVWLDSGEAYFEVAHRDGLPFIVHAGNRQVTVLGTKFSVRRIGGEVAVSVLEGRVRVDEVEGSRSLRSTIIAGGDIARTSGPATLVIARSDKRVEDSLAWRDGMLSFDGTSLADAAAEFNRYNRKPIVVAGPDVGGMRIGGLFPATKPDAFVRLLRDAYGLKVEEAADSFKVSS